MKKMKKLTSILLALLMTMLMVVPAFATANTGAAQGDGAKNPHTITINGVLSDKHEFKAYQIFKGEVAVGNNDSTIENGSKGNILSNIEWGSGVDSTNLVAALRTNDTLKALFTNETYTAEEVAGVLKDFSKDQLDAFAEVVNANLSAVAVTSGDAEAKTVENKTTYTYKIDVTGDGYYIVVDSTTGSEGDAVSKLIVGVVDNVTVTTKSDAPSLDKKIVEGENRVQANNGAVGDTVTFELKSKVPVMDGYDKYYFIIKDKLSDGLTYGELKSIKIASATKADGTLLPEIDVMQNNAYTLTTGEQTNDEWANLKIVFKNFLSYAEYAGADITIVYTATINENALIGSTGNPNDAKLVYSNNPNKEQNGENEPGPGDDKVTGETPKSTTITYVTEIDLTKIDGATAEGADPTTLAGAEFKITGVAMNKVKVTGESFEEAADGTYYKLTDGTYTETAPTEETKDQYVDTTVKYNKVLYSWINTSEQPLDKAITASVDANGLLKLTGLKEGVYKFEETKAPNGYNALTEPFYVTIKWDAPDGSKLTGSETCTWTYAKAKQSEYLGAGVEVGTADEFDVSKNNPGKFEASNNLGYIAFNVENNKGTQLPETGGIGTTIFYTLGGLMVLGAGIVLIARKRMGKQ